MAGDYLVAVARWLAARTSSHHQFSDLGVLVDKTAPDRQADLEIVRAAVCRLDALGLVVFYHHVTMPAVATQHREALRLLAAGEPLADVAAAVESDRPVTIIRLGADGYVAWYRSALRLPVCAAITGVGGARGSTPDEALAALRAQALAACRPEWSPGHVAHRQ